MSATFVGSDCAPTPPACRVVPQACPAGQTRICLDKCVALVGLNAACALNPCSAVGDPTLGVCDPNHRCVPSGPPGRGVCAAARSDNQILSCSAASLANGECPSGFYCRGVAGCSLTLVPGAPAPNGGYCAVPQREGEPCDGNWSDVVVSGQARCRACEPGTMCDTPTGTNSGRCRRGCDPATPMNGDCPCGDYRCRASVSFPGLLNVCYACRQNFAGACAATADCCDALATCDLQRGACCRPNPAFCTTPAACCGGACVGNACATCSRFGEPATTLAKCCNVDPTRTQVETATCQGVPVRWAHDGWAAMNLTRPSIAYIPPYAGKAARLVAVYQEPGSSSDPFAEFGWAYSTDGITWTQRSDAEAIATNAYPRVTFTTGIHSASLPAGLVAGAAGSGTVTGVAVGHASGTPLTAFPDRVVTLTSTTGGERYTVALVDDLYRGAVSTPSIATTAGAPGVTGSGVNAYAWVAQPPTFPARLFVSRGGSTVRELVSGGPSAGVFWPRVTVLQGDSSRTIVGVLYGSGTQFTCLGQYRFAVATIAGSTWSAWADELVAPIPVPTSCQLTANALPYNEPPAIAITRNAVGTPTFLAAITVPNAAPAAAGSRVRVFRRSTDPAAGGWVQVFETVGPGAWDLRPQLATNATGHVVLSYLSTSATDARLLGARAVGSFAAGDAGSWGPSAFLTRPEPLSVADNLPINSTAVGSLLGVAAVRRDIAGSSALPGEFYAAWPDGQGRIVAAGYGIVR